MVKFSKLKKKGVFLMCYQELEKIIDNSGISKKELSQMLGISLDDLGRKLACDTEFTLWEIKCLSKIFSLKGPQILHIFFNKKFPKGNN